jgi:hypothetical protein
MSSKITEELRDSLVRCARAGLLNTVSYAALNVIADRIDAEHERCKEESAKLRELVADAHACKENDGCCEDCYANEGDCPIEQRMRELGVEVDE